MLCPSGAEPEFGRRPPTESGERVQHKALKRVLTLPVADRHAVLADGLELLAEHANTLAADAATLLDVGRPRGAAAINALAREHAARFLILLDLVRLGWRDQQRAQRQVKRFVDHRAAGIYAEVSVGRPADLAEVRRYVDHLRRQRYLDGPNDVDWIFRNSVDADREEALYVDYVSTEDEDRWLTPALRDNWWHAREDQVVTLVGCMQRAGLTAKAALDMTAAAWRTVLVEDDTNWQVVRRVNVDVLKRVADAGLQRPGLTQRDLQQVVETWTFPLYALDMSPIEVSDVELHAERDHWLQAQL